jgi:hypothetical protein
MFLHQTFRMARDWRGSERSILRRKVARIIGELRLPLGSLIVDLTPQFVFSFTP